MQRDALEGFSAAEDDLAALEAFVVENPELRELERQIAPFNVFEALGVVRQELRHSDFLAFLLDPRQNHGPRGRHPETLSATSH